MTIDGRNLSDPKLSLWLVNLSLEVSQLAYFLESKEHQRDS